MHPLLVTELRLLARVDEQDPLHHFSDFRLMEKLEFRIRSFYILSNLAFQFRVAKVFDPRALPISSKANESLLHEEKEDCSH